MKYFLLTLFVVASMWLVANGQQTCQWTLAPRTPIGTILSEDLSMTLAECCQECQRDVRCTAYQWRVYFFFGYCDTYAHTGFEAGLCPYASCTVGVMRDSPMA